MSIDAFARGWEARDPSQWASDRSRYLAFAKDALAGGAAGLAFDVLSAGIAAFPDDRELKYLAALSLAKGGSTGHASRLVRSLLAGAGPSVDTDLLSLAGRIAKDRWSKLPSGAERARAGEEACASYRRAFELSRDPFPGINAATMALLTGQADEARRLAGQVQAMCESRQAAAGDPWLPATLGEARLLQGDVQGASNHYAEAWKQAAKRHGDIASMRRQLRLLSAKVAAASHLLEVLAMPRVAIFTGHMIDLPDAAAPRFPARIEAQVRRAIDDAIDTLGIGFAYCSAACGADLLFAEAMLERGAELNVVLPFQNEDFLRTSVVRGGVGWAARFESVLARASRVTHCVQEGYLGDDVLFSYAGHMMQGLAVLHAEQMETEVVMLGVADAASAEKPGGTLHNLRKWREQGRRVHVVDLHALRASASQGDPRPASADAPATHAREAGAPWGQREIRTMLFADVVGYSKLREHETPRFFVEFLGAVDKQIRAAHARPAFGNTWGDGLYLVFEDAKAGAEFALGLRDAIASSDWRKCGLPADLSLRIAMHTGPVFRARDPIIGQENFFGAHVTRTARIEPVTAPGSVYVSEQMAAVLAADGERSFACDYLGTTMLAKQYGSERLYRLRRAVEAD